MKLERESPGRPPPLKAVLARARRAFRERYGVEAALAASAPGRVNLIGDHTDYSGGLVLPMAIDRWCVAVAGPAARGGRAGRWRVHAADLGQDAELIVSRAIEPGSVARGLWVSYVAGVAAGYQALIEGPLPAMDVAIASSVPAGSGLSSSAALEVSVATLLEGVLGVEVEPVERARLCQRAEHEFAGVPCGLMDQLTSVMGRAGHALLIDCRSEQVRPVRLPRREEAAVLVIDSGVRHELGAGEYAERRAACESAARTLGLVRLRDAEMSMAERLELSEEERRCVRHVVAENARVAAAAGAMEAGDLGAFGRLMLASHESLRDVYRVSCAEVDEIVERVSGVAGVYGARMTGGGFGGSVVVLAHPAALPGVRAATAHVLSEWGETPGVVPVGGARLA